VLELAKQHDKASEIEKVQRYQMPSEKGELLHSFLEEEEKEKRAGYEQKKWEEEHLQQATLKFGAKDAKTRHQAREITVASVGGSGSACFWASRIH
jgi:pre-mRNA-splicing factor ATP-dependent RNA helicase DHX16